MEETAHIIENQKKIAGVRFRENWKVYDFDSNGIELIIGDRVIVDSERGAGFAQVVRVRKIRESDEPVIAADPVEEIPEGVEMDIDEAEKKSSPDAVSRVHPPKGSRKVLRKATGDDIAREEKNRVREAEAFSIAQDIISERELPMKLIRVEYSFDASRATFYFFSETRIDFREMVKDLAFKLKSRIEMRQIGVRDVARMIGGFGPCGRELCCSSFLKNFEPVSIRMAKKQDMVLNPAKISGVCGRLLCCLSYEYEMYDQIKKDVSDMRDAAVKEKRDEEERRIHQERRQAEEQRTDDRKRQEDRRHHEQRHDKPKEAVLKDSARPEKKKNQPEKSHHERIQPQKNQQQKNVQEKSAPEKNQDKKTQARADRPAEPQQPAAALEGQQVQQKAQQAQPEGEKQGGKKKRRRFWRRKKKGQQGGENKPPQGNGGAPAAT